MAGATYDFTDGTFHLFKVMARRTGATLSLIVWHVLAYAALLSVLWIALSPAFPVIINAIEQNREPTETEILTLIGSVWLAMSLFYLLALALALMAQGAWLRLLTHGRTASGIPFRFGLDELRLLGVNASFMAMGFVGWLVFSLIFGLFAFGAVGLGQGMDETAAASAVMLIFPLLFLVIMPLVIFIALRFAAAPAMTVNEGRFRLFESFKATRGIWGWMLLSYIVIYFVVVMGASTIGGLQFFIGFMALFDIFQVAQDMPYATEPSEYLALVLRPGPIIAIVLIVLIQLIIQVLTEALYHSVGAYAALHYERHKGTTEITTAPSASVGEAPGEG